MNTLLTILIYFAVGSLVVFIIGLSIQTIQSRSKNKDRDQAERKQRGENYQHGNGS